MCMISKAFYSIFINTCLKRCRDCFFFQITVIMMIMSAITFSRAIWSIWTDLSPTIIKQPIIFCIVVAIYTYLAEYMICMFITPEMFARHTKLASITIIAITSILATEFKFSFIFFYLIAIYACHTIYVRRGMIITPKLVTIWAS